MKNSIVVTGSIAIDTLFYHNGAIQDSLVAGKEPISVAFNVRTQEHFWGGCAGNIVFNGSLYYRQKSANALPFHMVGIVGSDFGEYKKWLTAHNIDTDHVIEVAEANTAHAYVMSDSKAQQVTFFYEGPGLYPHIALPELSKKLTELLPEASLLHAAPNSLWFMTECMQQARAHHIPYFFDPGQAMNIFNKAELYEGFAHAHGGFVNEYEYNRAGEILGVELQSLLSASSSLHFLVITKGEKGSTILLKEGDPIDIPITEHAVVDPTGCGDAYRGAFLGTLHEALTSEGREKETSSASNQKSLEGIFADKAKTRQLLSKAGSAGSLLAGRCLGVKGTQRHSIQSLH